MSISLSIIIMYCCLSPLWVSTLRQGILRAGSFTTTTTTTNHNNNNNNNNNNSNVNNNDNNNVCFPLRSLRKFGGSFAETERDDESKSIQVSEIQKYRGDLRKKKRPKVTRRSAEKSSDSPNG